MLKRISAFFIISVFAASTFLTLRPAPAAAVSSGGLYNNSNYAIWVFSPTGYQYNVPAHSNSFYIAGGVSKFQARYGYCGRYYYKGNGTLFNFRYGYRYTFGTYTVVIYEQHYCKI